MRERREVRTDEGRKQEETFMWLFPDGYHWRKNKVLQRNTKVGCFSLDKLLSLQILVQFVVRYWVDGMSETTTHSHCSVPYHVWITVSAYHHLFISIQFYSYKVTTNLRALQRYRPIQANYNPIHSFLIKSNYFNSKWVQFIQNQFKTVS